MTEIDLQGWFFDGPVAQWEGKTLRASYDLGVVRLYQPEPGPDFVKVSSERWCREFRPDEIIGPLYARTECRWRGEPCLALAFRPTSDGAGAGGQDAAVLVEYAGGNTEVGRSLGLRSIAPVVFRGWVPAAELTAIRRVVVGER